MGLSYGLSFPLHDHMFHEQRLVFQALSRPGAGKTILTGCGDEDLRLKAELAGHWARVNRDMIVDDLQGPLGGGAVLGKNRDLHLHVLHYVEGTPATVARLYCAAMGVAIASLLARRLPQRHVAVLGDVTTHDLFISSTTPMVTRVVDVESMYAQGFRQLVVPRRVDVHEGCLADSGIDLWVDEDVCATFTSALPNIFGLAPPGSSVAASADMEA